MRIFMLDTNTRNNYVTIKTSMAYQLAIKYIGIDISFRQNALALQATKEVVMVSKLGGMNDLKIATFVRVQCSANFPIISNISPMVWTFSIALDGSTCMGTSYIDICACFVWRRWLYNLHLISNSFYLSHTCLSQFEILCKLFDVLSPSWRNQLIGALSDEARNITGPVAGVITRLQQCLLEGFIRVWCILH